MTDRIRNIMVGVTTLAAMACVAILLLLFGYVPAFISPGYTVHAHLPHSQGINDASRVWLYGIDVGHVEAIDLAPFPERGVKLTMRLRKDVNVPLGTRVIINTPLLGGTASISLDTSSVDTTKPVEYLPTDGSAELHPEPASAGLESRVAQELRAALETAAGNLQKELSTRLDKYDALIVKVDELSTEWTHVARNINQITSPRSPESVDKGEQPGNLASAATRMDDRIKELQASIASINQWAGDEKLREDIQVAAANARKISEKLDASVTQINEVTAGAKEQIDRLTTRFVASADDLSAAIKSMNQTLADIREGKGTTGKLITDPALYNNLNDTVQRMGKAADEFKLMIEKMRKEGIPLQL